MNRAEADLSDLELRVMAGNPAAMRDTMMFIKHATAFGAALSHHPQEGVTMSYPQEPAGYANAPQIPPPAPLYANSTQAAQARVKQAQENLSVAEAALAAKQAHDARIELIEADYNLAGATQILMASIKNLVNGYSTTQELVALAKYRKELQPLAERHGFKIVLVGNKTQATVVEV